MAYLTTSLQECAEYIQNGGLVAFPTETVYGLGANALSEPAVRSIFQAKKRPLNDPVIVHVSSLSSALSLISESDPGLLRLYSFLGTRFWPGPLTLVCKAAAHLPSVLMAGTGNVGVRCPNHPLALELISAANVPIAAPSANLFSHVSPTTPEHVLKDFSQSEYSIKVLPGGKCSFGIESTVAKLSQEAAGYRVHILRKGGVSELALQTALTEAGFLTVTVSSVSRDHYLPVTEQAEGPGQLLKHYSPAIDTYISVSQKPACTLICPLSQVAVLDFKSLMQGVEGGHRRNLSESGDVTEAINNLYAALRWTEELEGVACVLLPDLREITQSEFVAALWDRIYRAAAGREAVCLNNEVFTATH